MVVPSPPAAVTFDCWNTLIYEPSILRSAELRAERLAQLLAGSGEAVRATDVLEAMQQSWQRHRDTMISGYSSGAHEIARWTLEHLGITGTKILPGAITVVEEASLEHGVRILEGARETLERLEALAIPRALICDTGMTPGRIVRRHLVRAGLEPLLQVLVFSDEVGVPKPRPEPFRVALSGLGARAGQSVHVGDLKRSDVAGAKGAGMASIRLRSRYDDPSPLPDADAVADSHAHLREILGIQ